MGKKGRIPQEERPPAGMLVDEVPDWLHRLPTDDQPGVSVAVHDPFAIVLLAGSGHPAEPLRRPGRGHSMGKAGVGKVAFPELAGLQAGVTMPGQDRRQGWRVPDEIVGFRAGRAIPLGGHAAHLPVAWRRVVEMDAVLMRVEAGQQRRQRRPAEAHGNVAGRIASGHTGQTVDVRSMHEVVAEKTEIASGLVVREDHDDVRAQLVGGSAAMSRGESETEREGGKNASDIRSEHFVSPSHIK